MFFVTFAIVAAVLVIMALTSLLSYSQGRRDEARRILEILRRRRGPEQ